MADSSSSPSSEIEAEPHPYQENVSPGPKGAYEARQLRGGLYVRVDMPGVPPDGVKLFKYSETRTVTFTGKAPKHWSFESSERVYGGYVVLDRDPTQLDVEITVKNGCLRLFFPSAEGTLHFFPSRSQAHPHPQHDNAGSNEQFVQDPDVVIGPLASFCPHPRDCPCCKGKEITASVIKSEKVSHINPSLLHGVEGVSEVIKVMDDGTERVYVRVDMPGLERKKTIAMFQQNRYLTFGGGRRKEYHLDKGGRTYLCVVLLQCTCCKIIDVVPSVRDGVFRISFQKFNIQKVAPSAGQ